MRNNIYLILGRPGCGKSWLARYLIKYYINKGLRDYFVILDDTEDHLEDLKSFDFAHCVFDRGLASSLEEIDFVNYIKTKKRILFETGDLVEEEIRRLVDKISLAEVSLGSSLFLIDEAHKFYPINRASLELERLTRGARKLGVDIIFVTQIPTSLNLTAIRLTTLLMAFQITEKNDLERIGSYFSVDKESLFDLKEREYLVKNLRDGSEAKEISIGLEA